jgi:hypothetical protein
MVKKLQPPPGMNLLDGDLEDMTQQPPSEAEPVAQTTAQPEEFDFFASLNS